MLDRAFLLLLSILAAYRVAALVTLENGPFNVFYLWRTMWGRAAAARRNAVMKTWAELWFCPYCLGVWIALGLALWLFYFDPISWILWWFAIAGGQAFLQSLSRDKDE